MKPLLLACLMPCLAFAARAGTSVLLARYKGAWRPVVAVSHSVPLVEDGGKYAAASQDQYQLGKLNRYQKGMPAPVIVDVGSLDFHQSDFHMGAMGGVEHDVPVVSGWIRSPVDLKHVFVVFDLRMPSYGRTVFVREVHDLTAGRKESFEFAIPPNRLSGNGTFQAHFFSDGMELLQSRLGEPAIRGDIERRISGWTEGVQNEDLQPYYVRLPARPASMRDDSPVRQVDVTTAVSPDGAVVSAKAAAGAPADYAAAAEKAVAGYLFLPRIVNGEAVASKVIISVQFDPKIDR